MYHSDLAVKPVGKAPSIPAKKISSNSYSGNGSDTVGPALYNPNYSNVKQRHPVGDFVTSKQHRKVFEPSIERSNNLPSRENPGPGQYQEVEKPKKKEFNAQGESSVFMSRVPNCKDVKQNKSDVPGPGFYEKKGKNAFKATDSLGESTQADSNYMSQSSTV